MTPEVFLDIAVNPALKLLQPLMTSTAAQALIVAIALQESGLKHRRQLPNGPAKSYAQFEKAGVMGVLTHAASRDHAKAVCAALDIAPTVTAVHAAIQYNDVLCAAFSRLLLWTDAEWLPGRGAAPAAWKIYLRTWRPGKPHQSTWFANYARGWDVAAGEVS